MAGWRRWIGLARQLPLERGVFGTAGLRYAILRRELPLVLEAFRYGNRCFPEGRPELDQAPILVHFRSKRRNYSENHEQQVIQLIVSTCLLG